MAARKTTSKAQNPALTGGPQTDAGKSTAAQNSRRHGLTAKNPLYTPEEFAALDTLTADLEQTYQPKGGAERQFLRDFAVQFQRQKRLDAYVQLLADRVTTTKEIGKLTPKYPLKFAFDFGGDAVSPDDEVKYLKELERNLPQTSGGWKCALVEYSERFVSINISEALAKSPVVKAIARHDGSGAPIAEVKQAIADRVAEVRDRQQRYQAERDRLADVELAIAVYESQLSESVEKIQGRFGCNLRPRSGT